jgi:glycosyltransferase involved in cell wall biosynthesis
MRRLIQLVPTHHRHDAAGAEVLVIERLIGAAGWSIETYADFIDPELRGRTRPSSDLDKAELDDAVALYHFCVASPMTERFLEMDCPKLIFFHNVTPPEFFEPYDPGIAQACADGLKQMRLLADQVDLAVAHSEFSRKLLVESGYEVTRTIPYLFDPSRLNVAPDKAMLRKLGPAPIVLFTGRFAPNKAPDDFIRVAAACAGQSGAPARFVIAGKRDVLPAYTREIESLIFTLGLGEDRLLVTDEITQAELIACYRSADLFLSLSRHEGFCVPLLEAMYFDVPILALARAAVPETVGDAACLFDTADPEEAAALVRLLLDDAERREELIARGRRRLERYRLEHWGMVLRVLLEEL